MTTIRNILAIALAIITGLAAGNAQTDSLRNVTMSDVVVTGTRNETDIRHLPMTVSVVDRAEIELQHQSSILPVLNTQVPGFFSTSRGILGYGVSTGVVLYLDIVSLELAGNGGITALTGTKRSMSQSTLAIASHIFATLGWSSALKKCGSASK